jgi:inorganic triphosphatase YgiF
MEIELKYAIDNEEIAAKIWEDEDLKKIEEKGTRETLMMEAIYFDTENMDLSKNDMAYRVRREGERLIASLKWGGGSDGALHKREEVNVPVMDTKPNPVIFEECNIGDDLIAILGGKELRPVLEMHIERKRFRVDTESTILEISVDQGNIVTPNGTEPVCEVEVEMFSGSEDVMMKTGTGLAEKYGLVSEKRSKFYRGLMLLGQR